MSRAKRRLRRRRFSPESPLVLDGQISVAVDVPARWGWLARPLAAFVGALPSYTLGRAGRGRAIVIRLAIGGAALLVAMYGRGDLAIGALAAAIGLTLVVLPVPDHRKRRWIASANALARPASMIERAAAAITFDGQKLVVRAGGRVWRSLRPWATSASVRVHVAPDRVVLGLCPRGSKTASGLYFEAPGDAATHATFEPVTPTAGFAPPAPTETVHVDPAGFADLHEVFWDAGTGGLPRASGPSGA